MIDLKEIVPHHQELARSHFSNHQDKLRNKVGVFACCSQFAVGKIGRTTFKSELENVDLHRNQTVSLINSIIPKQLSSWSQLVDLKPDGFDEHFRSEGENIEQMLLWILCHLDKIIIGIPDELLHLSNELRQAYPSVVKGENGEEKIHRKIIKNIFRFNQFSQKNGYDFTETLGVSVCPYCNLDYTFTLRAMGGEMRDILRPPIDHFFSKNTHPLLALSFYNLIPSCTTCNSVLKNTQEVDLTYFLNPWIGGLAGKGEIEIHLSDLDSFSGQKGNYFVHFHPSSKTPNSEAIIGNVLLFELERRYEVFPEEVKEMVQRYRLYNPQYVASIARMFQEQGLKLHKEEIDRFALQGRSAKVAGKYDSLFLLRRSIWRYLRSIPSEES